MVLGEVREDPAREADARRAAELEGVRGHLHHARRVARVDHPAEGGLEVDGLRRRALDGLLGPAHHLPHGAEQAGAHPGRLEDLAHEEGRGGLAVRAGDAHHPQRARSGRRESARRPAPSRARTSGTTTSGTPRSERPLADQRGGAALDGVGGEVVAVAREAGHAEEERPGETLLLE